MKLKKLVLACCVLSLVFFPAFSQKKITLKVASIAPGRSQWDVDQRMMAQEILKATNGEVAIQFYDSNTMGGEKSIIQKLRAVRPGQKAAIDGAIFTSIGVYELAPASNVLTLCIPFLFREQAELDLVLKNFPGMRHAVEDEGYEVLGWFSVGWCTFLTKDLIRTPEQLKRVKMSVGTLDSPALGELFQQAGFNTFDVPVEKLLSNLKSSDGVRGLYSIPMFAYAAQYSKSLPYIIDAPVCPVLAGFVVSKQSWAAVPEKHRIVIQEIVKKTEERFLETQQKTDREYLDLMEKEGNTLVKLTPEEYAHWEKTFQKDAEQISRSKNPAFNLEFFNQIQSLLSEFRAGKK